MRAEAKVGWTLEGGVVEKTRSEELDEGCGDRSGY